MLSDEAYTRVIMSGTIALALGASFFVFIKLTN